MCFCPEGGAEEQTSLSMEVTTEADVHSPPAVSPPLESEQQQLDELVMFASCFFSPLDPSGFLFWCLFPFFIFFFFPSSPSFSLFFSCQTAFSVPTIRAEHRSKQSAVMSARTNVLMISKATFMFQRQHSNF